MHGLIEVRGRAGIGGGGDVMITDGTQHSFQNMDVALLIINDQDLGIGEFSVSG
jgi:hypothetical protein